MTGTIMTGEDYVKQNEGLRLKMYKCTAGYDTIGYGHNLNTKPITKLAADAIFIDDFADALNDLMDVLTTSYVNLTEWRKVALVDLMFNVGKTTFRKFTKMRAALKKSQYGLAADEMLDSKYAREDVPKRAARNAYMLRTGEFYKEGGL